LEQKYLRDRLNFDNGLDDESQYGSQSPIHYQESANTVNKLDTESTDFRRRIADRKFNKQSVQRTDDDLAEDSLAKISEHLKLNEPSRDRDMRTPIINGEDYGQSAHSIKSRNVR
jgi:hypothetical protein